MPEKDYAWLPKQELLSFEEIHQLVDIFATCGVRKIHLTGGEPLLRRNLYELISMLSQNSLLQDIALTTNGILLQEHAQSLFTVGLHRITVSLDTLRSDRFQKLTGQNLLPQVLQGIKLAQKVGFQKIKINMVVIRGVNDDEIIPMIEFGKSIQSEIRFIEYMDVGGATKWSFAQVVSKKEILQQITNHYGDCQKIVQDRSIPAEYYQLHDQTTFGIISSTTSPFCHSCDRTRITADGMWYLCLYAKNGINLRELLRNRTDPKEISALIQSIWKKRKDKGAEERLNLQNRGPLFQISHLQKNPHLEMHTRGG